MSKHADSEERGEGPSLRPPLAASPLTASVSPCRCGEKREPAARLGRSPVSGPGIPSLSTSCRARARARNRPPSGLPGTEASPTPVMPEVVTTWVRAGFLGGPAATPPPRARPRHRDPGLPGTLVHAALKTSPPHDGRSRGAWRCRAGRWRQALRPVTHGRGLNYRGRGCGAWRCPGNCIQQMHHADLLKY